MRSGPSARSNQIMLAVKCAVAACAAAATPAHAQQAGLPGEECKPGQPSCVQEVVVTGSRIARVCAQAEQPLSFISAEAIEKTGLASVGELLLQLTTGGNALDTKSHSSGTFGH